MARDPFSTLKLLDSALAHLLAHVAGKNTFSLSIVDLLHVSNFKGGNASITEPEPALSEKLLSYSQHLARIAQTHRGRTLGELSDRELIDVQKAGTDFLLLTRAEATRIRGSVRRTHRRFYSHISRRCSPFSIDVSSTAPESRCSSTPRGRSDRSRLTMRRCCKRSTRS